MCTIIKGPSRTINVWRGHMKKQAQIEEIQEHLARWNKVIADNVHMKAIEETAKVKFNQQQVKSVNEELKLASRAILLVRQAALRDLLHSENQRYLEELHSKGKTIFTERL
ncbi:cilia- and flagella-associated protein 141-like [Narcine bancroftii]|uniref:cilia- and flagella-associated protein 141-like n=1 Tax=Narcine bancroftii TaxID=1343680 RepID=UPI00383174FF